MSDPLEDSIKRAAAWISRSEALLIGAGAGMGVDSGLPDFRGNEGFWNAYPLYKNLGLSFSGLANPRWFRTSPSLAWGFYGHRLNLYRETAPHDGFAILREWSERMPLKSFVFTSNVDGHFQKAGFHPERVLEVHGAIGNMQCLAECGIGVFSADAYDVNVSPETMRALDPMPECPACGWMARPNILMFGDAEWDSSNTDEQRLRLESWLNRLRGRRFAIVECGAGTAIPTVRLTCERFAKQFGGMLIRINPRDWDVPMGHVGIPLNARDGLLAIRDALPPGP